MSVFAATEPVAARHIHEPSKQMHNRGNGKGGGMAAIGFVPEQLGVTREVLDTYYMVHVAFLDNGMRPEVEGKYITPCFDIHTSYQLETVADWTTIPSIEASRRTWCAISSGSDRKSLMLSSQRTN